MSLPHILSATSRHSAAPSAPASPRLRDRDHRRREQVAGLVVRARIARAVALLAVPARATPSSAARACARSAGVMPDRGASRRRARCTGRGCGSRSRRRASAAASPPSLVADLIEIVEQRGEEPDRGLRVVLARRSRPTRRGTPAAPSPTPRPGTRARSCSWPSRASAHSAIAPTTGPCAQLGLRLPRRAQLAIEQHPRVRTGRLGRRGVRDSPRTGDEDEDASARANA